MILNFQRNYMKGSSNDFLKKHCQVETNSNHPIDDLRFGHSYLSPQVVQVVQLMHKYDSCFHAISYLIFNFGNDFWFIIMSKVFQYHLESSSKQCQKNRNKKFLNTPAAGVLTTLKKF